jgi:hypothetical protein
MAQLLVLGLTMLCIFIGSMLAMIANRLGEIVKELKDIRLSGLNIHMEKFTLDVGNGLLDKIANKFTKKGGAKRNGQRKAAKRD